MGTEQEGRSLRPAGTAEPGDNPVEFRRDPLGYLLGLARRHGGLVPLGPQPEAAFLVSDPALIEQVLVTDKRLFTKGRWGRWLAQGLGHGLLTSEGALWRQQRRLAQPAFQREQLGDYAPLVIERAEALAATLVVGQVRDLYSEMTRLALEIVGRTLLGCDLAADVRDIRRGLNTLMEHYRDRTPWQPSAPPPDPSKDRALQRLDDIIYGLLRSRARAQPTTAGPPPDLLGRLLLATDEGGQPLSEAQIRDELLTLLLAGHETTALALSCALLLLSRHPEAEAKLGAELRAVLGDRAPRPEDLPRLRYTECVVLEALRLYPPVWLLSREATEDVVLGTRPLRAGTEVFISPFVVHHDPRRFPEPEAFRPERWLDGAPGLPRCAYVPFSSGPRQCIGQGFALLETTLVLASLLRRHRLVVPEQHPIGWILSVTLRPRYSLLARVEARTPPS